MYRRRTRLQIGSIVVEDLNIKFEITKTNKGLSEQKATFSIMNMSPEKANTIISEQRGTIVEFRCGHGDDLFTIYTGEVDFASFFVKAPNTELHILCRNITGRSVDATWDRAYPKETPWSQVINDLVKATGFGRGNIDVYLSRVRIQGSRSAHYGTATFGNAWRSLVYLFASTELNISVVDGTITVSPLDGGEAKVTGQVTVPLISPTTGLLGDPKLVQKTQATGGKSKVGVAQLLEIQCIIQPGIVPGSKIRLESRLYNTIAVVQSATWQGETYSDEFRINIEAAPSVAIFDKQAPV